MDVYFWLDSPFDAFHLTVQCYTAFGCEQVCVCMCSTGQEALGKEMGYPLVP
jgi:hypothetical protein